MMRLTSLLLVGLVASTTCLMATQPRWMRPSLPATQTRSRPFASTVSQPFPRVSRVPAKSDLPASDSTPTSTAAASVTMSAPLEQQAGEAAYDVVGSVARKLTENNNEEQVEQVSAALKRLKRDFGMLDVSAGATPQLSSGELLLLFGAVGTAFTAPFAFGSAVVEVLVPSMSALAAAIGFSAEYTGKVAVARGKEVAAITLQAAAESEMFLARAERAKAIIPLCVGVSATAAAFALLAPALVSDLAQRGLETIFTSQLYLIAPLVSVLAAAVAALASQETNSLGGQAISVGARRFASASVVGRTWLSATEQVGASADKTKEKWVSFTLGMLPAPVLAALVPGTIAFKAIVAAAVGAAQAAYSLADAEYTLSAAVESVALKSRAAATADTFANQGARAGAILPFTSALSGLCAATTVAVVEVLPLLPSTLAEALVGVTFPAIGALIAAAASISKARAEVDSAAATEAASAVADSEPEMNVRDPIKWTIDLINLTIRSLKRMVQRRTLTRWIRALFGRRDPPEETMKGVVTPVVTPVTA
jgi:hypothetical protein